MAKQNKPTNNKDQTAAYHHGDLRNALIEAGLEILAQEGANALSLREVARKAGVSHAAPYRHFADKEALIAAIAAEVGSKLTPYLLKAIARFPDDYHAQFLEMGWAYVLFGLENPNQWKVLFSSFTTSENIPFREAFELLVDTIRKGQEAGVFVTGNPFSLAMATWAMVHGLAVLMIENSIIPDEIQEITTKENLARACVEILFKGVERR
jgi:AcrR family transcriptional regulator